MATNTTTTSQENNYKVRLISVASVVAGKLTNNPDQVVFNVTPAFQETGGVEYATVQPVHLPGGIQVYKKTSSRTFTIGAKFISRTVAEATLNMQYLQTLRSWRMPYFGSSSTLADSTNRVKSQTDQSSTKVSAEQQSANAVKRANDGQIELLGAPPNILYLYAYSTGANDTRQHAYGVNINRVPVVLTELSITYPEDVDYLPVNTDFGGDFIAVSPTFSEPFPIKMDVSITLLETHSPLDYEKFSLMSYKTGQLTNF